MENEQKLSAQQQSQQSSQSPPQSITTDTPTVASLRNYSNIVKNICKSSGLFIKRNQQLETQLNMMNNMMEQLSITAIPSIKNDIYNILMKTIDWKIYQDNLKKALRNSKEITKQNVFYLKPLDFSTDDDEIPQIDISFLTNMNLTMYNIGINDKTTASELTVKQKRKINEFIELRDELFTEIDNTLDEFVNYEQSFGTMRKNNLDIMKQNIATLYTAHLKHVNNKMLKKTMEKVRVYYNDIELVMYDSQKEFITNAINAMLNA